MAPRHRSPQLSWADKPVSGGTATTRLSGRDQVAYEDEGLARRDRVPCAPVPVGQVRRDDQLTAAADLHARHALVPAGDDLPGAEPELQRVAPIPACVEFLPGGKRHPDIVHRDQVAWAGRAAVSLPDVGDLQPGRRLAARKIDLRPADAHNRPLLSCALTTVAGWAACASTY